MTLPRQQIVRALTAAARAVPVLAALLVAVAGPGVWVTAAAGLVILVYVVALDAVTSRTGGAMAAVTVAVAAPATAVVAALFWLPAPATWVIVPGGMAAAAIAYAVAVRPQRRS
ncbi:MAG TPA: hypothetical protein VGL93_13635 [Streptosporangiaceae bacterium]|jgi:hypothetical protein